VKWKKTDKAFTMQLAIPVGSEASVTLPVKAQKVLVDGEQTDTNGQIEILSGEHRIECELNE
jgi:hypothetical protein